MKFEKDMKEWNMFGELYTLLKKCTMEHMNQKQLWALCVEFGQKYSDEGDFDSLSYQLACNLYSYSLLDNRTSPFTFGNDSEEKKMFTAFYKLCQKYWTRQTETEDAYWNGCVKELSEFENCFSTIKGEPFALSQAWAITMIEYWNKKN